MSEQVLDHMEGMLDLCPDACLELLEPILQPAQLIRWQRLAHAALRRDQPFDGLALVLRPLLHALVARIAKHRALLTVQQSMGLADVTGVGGSRDQRMHQARLGIDADAKCQFLPFFV